MAIRSLTPEELDIFLGSTIRAGLFSSRFVPAVNEQATGIEVNDYVMVLPPSFFTLDFAERWTMVYRGTLLVAGQLVPEELMARLLRAQYKLREPQALPLTYSETALAPEELVISYAGSLPSSHDLQVSREVFAGELFRELVKASAWDVEPVALEMLGLVEYEGNFCGSLEAADTLWAVTELIVDVSLRTGSGCNVITELYSLEGNMSQRFKWTVPVIKPAMGMDMSEHWPFEDRQEARVSIRDLIGAFEPYVKYAMDDAWAAQRAARKQEG